MENTKFKATVYVEEKARYGFKEKYQKLHWEKPDKTSRWKTFSFKEFSNALYYIPKKEAPKKNSKAMESHDMFKYYDTMEVDANVLKIDLIELVNELERKLLFKAYAWKPLKIYYLNKDGTSENNIDFCIHFSDGIRNFNNPNPKRPHPLDRHFFKVNVWGHPLHIKQQDKLCVGFTAISSVFSSSIKNALFYTLLIGLSATFLPYMTYTDTSAMISNTNEYSLFREVKIMIGLLDFLFESSLCIGELQFKYSVICVGTVFLQYILNENMSPLVLKSCSKLFPVLYPIFWGFCITFNFHALLKLAGRSEHACQYNDKNYQLSKEEKGIMGGNSYDLFYALKSNLKISIAAMVCSLVMGSMFNRYSMVLCASASIFAYTFMPIKHRIVTLIFDDLTEYASQTPSPSLSILETSSNSQEQSTR